MRSLPAPVIPVPATLSSHLCTALGLLLQASNHAAKCQRDPWDFAVEIADLKYAGLTTADLRLLLCEGYVKHAVEMTKPGAQCRHFCKPAGLLFSDKSCFVLTQAGAITARTLRAEKLLLVAETPYWDERNHTLFWKSRALKHFRQEAPNQEAVLHTFQARQWLRCVTVTLAQDSALSSKERLHYTIKNLNRNVRPHLRFRQEGSGSRVSWEALPTLSHYYPNATPTRPLQ